MKIRMLPLVLALFTLTAATPATFQFPDTDAGRRAAAYVGAFNTGEDAVRACIEANVSRQALAQRSVDERLAIYRDLHDEHGRLTPVRLVESAEDHVQFIVRTAHDEMLDLTVLCEAEAPHMMVGLRIMEAPPENESPGAAAAPAKPLSEPEAIKAWRTHLDSLARLDEFSGAVLFAKKDEVLFEKAWGEASREQHVANRIDTRFNLGSINKAFTMTAIAQLVEQGKIKLDDTIDHYLPEYPRAAAGKVTVRHLLEHRGGIGDIFGEAYDRVDKSTLRTIADWIPLFRDQPLAFEPGTRQQYSNGGYILLGAIIEKVSGESYFDYVRRHIYQPAGMTGTDAYAKDQQTPNLAEGYTRKHDPGVEFRGPGPANNAATRPMRGSSAGGGYSTLHDMVSFTRALRDRKLFKVDDPSFHLITPGPDGRIGIGIGGGAPGINAALEVFGDYTIVVLANLDPPTAERAAATMRRWLQGGSGGREVRIGAGGPSGAVAPGGVQTEDIGGPHPGPAAPARTTIPAGGVEVEMSRSGHLPALSVMINGKGPYRFALDTGGGGAASVDSAVAAALGLEVVGQARSGDPSGRNTVTVDLVRLESLSIGGARFEGVDASVRSGRLRSMGEPVDGILGFRLFENCLMTLDYPGNRLRLASGELPPVNGRDVLAFTRRHGIPAVQLQVDSLQVEADVDAGAPGGFMLPARLESKLGFATAPRVIGRGRTIGNDFEIRAGEIKGAVRLGGFEFPGATVGLQPVFPTANVGAQVLREFRVTFDQKNGRMKLERAT